MYCVLVRIIIKTRNAVTLVKIKSKNFHALRFSTLHFTAGKIPSQLPNEDVKCELYVSQALDTVQLVF